MLDSDAGAHRLDYLADGLDEGFGHIIFSNSARRGGTGRTGAPEKEGGRKIFHIQ